MSDPAAVPPAPTIEDRLAAVEAAIAEVKAVLVALPVPKNTADLEAKVAAMMGDVAQMTAFKAGLQKHGIGQGL